MRDLSFPLMPLGADPAPEPDVQAVSAWIAGIRGSEADLISYQTDTLTAAQMPYAAVPTAGGAFYRPRILEAFGIHDDILTDAPDMKTGLIEADASRVKKTAKQFRFSLPAPCSLAIENRYYTDTDEYQETLAEAYAELCRTLRDIGSTGCVLRAETPSEIELEKLHGRKYLWSADADAAETVLEWTHDLVLAASSVSLLEDLADRFTIHHVYLADADAASLKIALKTFEPDHIFVAGYAGEDADAGYWKQLADLTVSVNDLE